MTAVRDAISSNKLRIAEIFSSIQGEGIWLGQPSTFIRVSGCNLRCAWCDTPYASWEPEGSVFDVDNVFQLASDYGNRHVVITGGEPMMFEAIEPLALRLKEAGSVITIETAGTVFREVACDLMSVSPKLSGSAPDLASGWRERHEAARIDLKVLRKLTNAYPFQLKFVVNPEEGNEISEIRDLLEALGLVGDDRILVMAEGRDAEMLHRRERLLAPICIENGFRLTPRFHIDLFGDTRGT